MIRHAYTSTVVGTGQFGFGLACAAAIGAAAAVSGAALWVTVVIVVVVVLVALHLSTVRICIGDGRMCIGQGPWNRPARHIGTEMIVAARALDLGWAQAVGIGVSLHRKTTRLTVRAGPSLELELDNREHIRISTQNPEAACELLSAALREA